MTGKRTRLAVGLAAAAVALAACATNAPQDTLDPAGPYAEKIDALFKPVFWVATAVFLLVEGGILYILWRYRHRKGRERIPPQIHGNTRLEIAWTILPAVVLAGVAVPTVATIFDLAAEPPGNALNVTVRGHQWWWEFRYTDPEMQVGDNLPLVTANELVIPADRPVYLTLESAGSEFGNGLGRAVIHSFSPFRLAGKTDVIPGKTNHMTIQADEPGEYPGQCAELCGFSHGFMRFEVDALSPADFDAWVAGQKEEAAAPSGIAGDLIASTCAACHTIRGVSTAASTAPDLTHVASRDCLAGCIFPNTREELAAWLRDPPARKLGSFMPDYNLSEEEIEALVDYLETLE
ncbi:MAG TPA: cytochrome c oxidase subunit II [Actinomycetota bacterium]|nr:cytochrome c oxidase subunit II [Actinomycetota bacterium]